MEKRKKRREKRLDDKRILTICLFLLIIALLLQNIDIYEKQEEKEKVKEQTTERIKEETKEVFSETEMQAQIKKKQEERKKEIQKDWKIRLANSENPLPEDFQVEVEKIDKNHVFDKRASKELNEMINNMREDGISNIWVQSAYREIETQKRLYQNGIQKYLKQGKTQEEAERLTKEYINPPGCSDHNLGLAVDFNYVDDSFEKTKAYQWLIKNAESYGFILRYPKEKEEITKIAYEPWHWRYVGEEHAKKINELSICLEEYIEELSKNTN